MRVKIRIFSECRDNYGLGHVARCFKLAVMFLENGYEVSFFVRGGGNYHAFLHKNKDLFVNKKFFPLSMEWLELKENNLFNGIAIIDSYEVQDISFFIANFNSILIFDDLGRFKNIENVLILSQNKLYENDKRAFFGAEYFPLISDYNSVENLKITPDCKNLTHKSESNNLQNNGEKSIDLFICFGGEDKEDLSYVIYEIFKDSGFKIALVLGENYNGSLNNTHNNQIQILKSLSLIDMSIILKDSKIAIISGGGILLEALNFVENIIIIQNALNQDSQINSFKNHINISTPDQLKDITNLHNILINKNKMIGLVGSKCKNIISSLSLQFINSKLNNKTFKSYTLSNLIAIDFCNVDENEALLIYECRNHEEVRKNMYGNEKISLNVHFKFLQSLKNNNYSKYFLIKYDTTYIGVVSLSQINLKHKKSYLGIYKNPFLKSSGINGYSLGSLLIDILKHIAFNEYGLNMLYLEVTSTNIKAIRFYEKEHFKFIGELPYGFREQNGNFIDVLIYGLKNENYIS